MRNTERVDRTSISLPSSLNRRLRLEARARKKPASAIVRSALERYFDMEGADPLPGVYRYRRQRPSRHIGAR